MKMTVECDDGLARTEGVCTAGRGKTPGELIGCVPADCVRDAHKAPSMGLLTNGGGPLPDVDIDNRAALYGLMDARD